MNRNILSRIILDILIAISLLNGWWFIALPLALIGSYSFSYFIEVVIAGIVYDSLFGFIPGMGLKGYAGTISAIVIVLILSLVKKVVRK